MKTAQFAKWQLQQLQASRERAAPDNLTVNVVLHFDRDPYDITRLAGWKYFDEAIHELAPDVPEWEWTDEQIKAACEISHFSYDYFPQDFSRGREDITIPIHGCTRKQINGLQYGKENNYRAID